MSSSQHDGLLVLFLHQAINRTPPAEKKQAILDHSVSMWRAAWLRHFNFLFSVNNGPIVQVENFGFPERTPAENIAPKLPSNNHFRLTLGELTRLRQSPGAGLQMQVSLARMTLCTHWRNR
jgi:hypothetical protein